MKKKSKVSAGIDEAIGTKESTISSDSIKRETISEEQLASTIETKKKVKLALRKMKQLAQKNQQVVVPEPSEKQSVKNNLQVLVVPQQRKKHAIECIGIKTKRQSIRNKKVKLVLT